MLKRTFLLVLLFSVLSAFSFANASEPEAKVALYISSNCPNSQNMSLNVANNLMNYYQGNASVEIVVFGPQALPMLAPDSEHANRLEVLVEDRGVRVSFCQLTVNSVKSRTGKDVQLIPQAQSVQSGAVRLIELVADGYVHIAP